MLRRFSIGLLASAIAMAPLPTKAQDGTAEDLGVMRISLADVVKPTIGFQGALQGAGTPNQAGIGGFLPLSVGDNSVWFLDALINANFGDRTSYSSIGDTLVSGTTLSTSTRLGYRWLNVDRSWMYGINGGYDTRQMATGDTTNGIPAVDPQTVFFQQVAVNAEAKSNQWGVNAYGLIPVGKYGYGSDNVATINAFYGASPLTTVGADIGYNILPDLSISGGYYYQYSEKEADQFKSTPDGSGLKARLAYDLSDQLQASVVYTYDENFESRVSADLKVRFGGALKSKLQQKSPVLQALIKTPENRNVRIANSGIPPFCIDNDALKRAWKKLGRPGYYQAKAQGGNQNNPCSALWYLCRDQEAQLSGVRKRDWRKTQCGQARISLIPNIRKAKKGQLSYQDFMQKLLQEFPGDLD